MNHPAVAVEPDSVRDYRASYRRMGAKNHGSAVSHQYSLKARVASQTNIAPISPNIEKNVVPFEAARQSDLRVPRQRELVFDVDNEGGGRGALKGQCRVTAHFQVIQFQNDCLTRRASDGGIIVSAESYRRAQSVRGKSKRVIGRVDRFGHAIVEHGILVVELRCGNRCIVAQLQSAITAVIKVPLNRAVVAQPEIPVSGNTHIALDESVVRQMIAEIAIAEREYGPAVQIAHCGQDLEQSRRRVKGAAENQRRDRE